MKRRIINKQSALFSLLLLVPLTAAADSQSDTAEQVSVQTATQDGLENPTLPELIDASSEPFSDIESANLDGLLERIADARLVLLGESSHGTAEFYDMRARITRELIEKKGFTIVAVEADWPDASVIDYFIRGDGKKPVYTNKPFSGYPSWMWANQPVWSFTQWLKEYNQRVNSAEAVTSSDHRVSFYGLDLYNLYSSIEAVLDYLQDVDPKAAQAANWAYGCLKPWADDPGIYSRVMQSGRHRGCANEVFAVLQDLRHKQRFYQQFARHRYFNAVQNARLVVNGERYYRTMFDDSADSWNQRDQAMFDTLLATLDYHGQTSKAVVWAHNSHIGDARATDRREHGELNLGQLVRETFPDSAYLVGFGTDHGTVAAASEWGGAMKIMQVPPSHADSYGYLFHQASADNFMLPLREAVMRKPVQALTRSKLLAERQLRAIGTMYDPDDELTKHYTEVSLPHQFDEYIWFDETHAVKPLSSETRQ